VAGFGGARLVRPICFIETTGLSSAKWSTLIPATNLPLRSRDIRARKRTIILIGVMQNRTTPGPSLTKAQLYETLSKAE
jgi:hypothetical protein